MNLNSGNNESDSTVDKDTLQEDVGINVTTLREFESEEG